MSRVSRLAQIRQRRDKGGNGEQRDLEPDSKILDTVRVQNEDGDEDEESVEIDESTEKIEAETDDSKILRPELDSMANDETTEDSNTLTEDTSVAAVDVDAPAGPEEPERLGLEVHSTSPNKQEATYNSDLKADLKLLHDRAKHATDRAITSVIQRKYQESLTQSES